MSKKNNNGLKQGKAHGLAIMGKYYDRGLYSGLGCVSYTYLKMHVFCLSLHV